MTERWHVEVDRAACIGSGICRGTVPGLFEADDDNKTVITRTPVDPDESILDAATTCPAEAITVTDTADGRVLAPED